MIGGKAGSGLVAGTGCTGNVPVKGTAGLGRGNAGSAGGGFSLPASGTDAMDLNALAGALSAATAGAAALAPA
ncbi:MAG: hypothetical protein WCO82_10355, partial [Sphingomonadales bacterium]